MGVVREGIDVGGGPVAGFGELAFRDERPAAALLLAFEDDVVPEGLEDARGGLAALGMHELGEGIVE